MLKFNFSKPKHKKDQQNGLYIFRPKNYQKRNCSRLAQRPRRQTDGPIPSSAYWVKASNENFTPHWVKTKNGRSQMLDPSQKASELRTHKGDQDIM